MNEKMLPANRKLPSASAPNDGRAIIAEFLANLSERTRRSYEADLEDFRAFVEVRSRLEAFAGILNAGPAGAFRVVTKYKAHLRARGLSPATINRRLACLRSLVKFARAAGLVNWPLVVPNLKGAKSRDTRGPGRAAVQAMIDAAKRRRDAKGVRDVAIMRLLYDLALRRGEVVSLDVEDVDLTSGVVMVLGKGCVERAPRTLPEPTANALRAWLAIRGPEPGPLFTNFDRAGKGGRLTGEAVYYLVNRLGARANVKVTPHGLRHAAITEALDRGGDVRAVQRYSRHKDLSTVLVYDDSRRDFAGEVARVVASGIR